MSRSISIIICTRNRAQSLRETLAAIGHCRVPAGYTAELVVIDNGSTDDTAEVVRSAKGIEIPVRYVREDKPGLSFARNRALAETTSDILVCTDDDVRPEPDWLVQLCVPIGEGIAHATVGTIRMPEHLRRPWLEPDHWGWLACNDAVGGPGKDLVGANMAFSRRVLTVIPQFDTEIGCPGSGGEDTLFSWQLRDAGFKVLAVKQAIVEHHFAADRLTRPKMLDAARKGGVSDFYLAYHWQHEDLPHPWFKFIRAWIRLWYYRTIRWSQLRHHEAVPAWEKGMIGEVAAARLYIRRRGEPRRYSKRGFIKQL